MTTTRQASRCVTMTIRPREALVDALAKDAHALLPVLEGGVWEPGVEQAGRLLAAGGGQDLDEGADGVFRIARRVAKDRVISTVDPQARHGHKTTARGFDGYKGHVGIDPDSEIITGTTATAGNVGDAEAAMDLLADDLPTKPAGDDRVILTRVMMPVPAGWTPPPLMMTSSRSTVMPL